jgi:hypothetical protein
MHGRDNGDQAAFYCNSVHDESIQQAVKTIFYPNLDVTKNIRRNPALMRQESLAHIQSRFQTTQALPGSGMD